MTLYGSVWTTFDLTSPGFVTSQEVMTPAKAFPYKHKENQADETWIWTRVLGSNLLA